MSKNFIGSRAPIPQSKKPSGLGIERTGTSFKCTWKTHSYKKQWFEWSKKDEKGKWGAWHSASVGKNTDSKTISLDWKNGNGNCGKKHPRNNGDYLYAFRFRVRGESKDKAGSKWESKSFDIKEPKTPSLSVEKDSTIANRCRFSWSVEDKGENAAVDVITHTRLVRRGRGVSWDGWSGSKSLSGSDTINENVELTDGSESYRRDYQVMARGPQGDSDPSAVRSHVYAKPNKPSMKGAELDGTQRYAAWSVDQDYDKKSRTTWRPVDELEIRESVGAPDASGQPESGSWTTVATIDPSGYDEWYWNTDAVVSRDQAIWYSVAAKHDQWTVPSDYKMAYYGGPSDPVLSSITLVNESTGEVRITIGGVPSPSSVETEVYLRTGSNPDWGKRVAVIPNGVTSINYTIPDYSETLSYQFAIRNHQKNDWPGVMYSGYVTGATIGTLPSAPTNLALSLTDVAGEVSLSWSPTMSNYDGSVVSWADHASAWTSTSEPSTYTIGSHAKAWTVAGLETGKTWYFAVRSVSGVGTDNVTYGPWSDIKAISLASSPVTPTLSAPAYITAGSSALVSWTYVSSDGTPQASATVAEGSGKETVGSVTSTVQHLEIGSDWAEGSEHTVYCKTRSASGVESNWSEGIVITVASTPTCSATAALTAVANVDDDGNAIQDIEGNNTVTNTLTALPLSVDITGSQGGTCHAMILKRGDEKVPNADGSETTLFDGQVIATASICGDGTVDIGTNSGGLFDGHTYTLRCWVQDTFGQVAYEDDIDFTVRWERHAFVPTLTVDAHTYAELGAIALTPVPGVGTITEDTTSGGVTTYHDRCDIYRVSADGAVLLVSDATWNEVYVDPYPPMGGIDGTGHRAVCVTPEGDMTTADGDMAWYDTSVDDGDEVAANGVVVNWNGNALALPWNYSLKDNYDKDFTRRSHLGGSTTGHWNPAVEHDRALAVQMIRVRDENDVILLRDLAQHAGVCHVRTPDGVCTTANVSVSEIGRDVRNGEIDVSVEVNAIDQASPEGLTKSAFDELISGGE